MHNVHRHSSGTYFVSQERFPGFGDDQGLERIRSLLGFLKSEADQFFRSRAGRLANYEDLYYLVTQLADAEVEYENPAIAYLLKQVCRDFTSPPFHGFSSFPPSDLLEEARGYIKDIVAHTLSELKLSDGHLSPVVDAATDPAISAVEIFTLNHDRLIEETFRRTGASLCTGFVPVSQDLVCWDLRSFAACREKARLYKLHGSVDWHPVRFESSRTSCVCIATQGDIEHACGPDGKYCILLPGGAEMLIGTFNKMLEYTMGIYADLFCAFRSALGSLDRLVISGYSFGDKGVNASIAEWTRQDSRRKLLVIAPHASDYSRNARGAIRRLLQDCRDQVTNWDRAFEKTTWPEISDWMRKGS